MLTYIVYMPSVNIFPVKYQNKVNSLIFPPSINTTITVAMCIPRGTPGNT